MDVRSPASVVFVLAAVVTAGCGRNSIAPASPAPVESKSAITADPLIVQPEFLRESACGTRPPFGLRLSVVARSEQELVLRQLQFRLLDARGFSAFPDVLPIPTTAPSSVFSPPNQIPTGSGAASLPASPVPIPGLSPTANVFIAAGTSQSLPFFLRFGCGIAADGTLVIAVDVFGRDGRSQRSDVRVRVGR